MNGIIFIGPQASGKSYFYLQHFYKTHIRLNMDMLNTRYRERLLFNACLEAKQPCVIDNTNPTKSERSIYIPEFKQHKFQIIGYLFTSTFEECRRRNELRSGREKVPEVGLKSVFKKLEKPEYSEGFDKIYNVSLCDNEFLIEELSNEIY